MSSRNFKRFAGVKTYRISRHSILSSSIDGYKAFRHNKEVIIALQLKSFTIIPCYLHVDFFRLLLVLERLHKRLVFEMYL